MKHSKLLIAAALSAATWCGVSQAQTVLYGVEYYGISTGTTPSESNWTVYPSQIVYPGYAVSQYRDYNGNWRERSDPVAVIGTQRNYVYPETTVYPSSGVIYMAPYDSGITPFDYTLTPRY